MAAALAGPQASPELLQLRKAIDQLGLISLSRLVSGAVDSLSSLASELHKPTPTIDLVHGDIAFNSQFAEALKSCLMHIVRNSLDHGIEAPAERLKASKPGQGKLRFACERVGDRVQLHISDDGRGLALHKLYEKGVASGLFGTGEQPTRDAVADVIFRSGLSTSEAVTQVSGRGVGMDAVRTFLKEQGASIRIALKESGQKLGFAPFEFIVDVPLAACSH
jgi:two-component system chemotaxis sensor kinase CheA